MGMLAGRVDHVIGVDTDAAGGPSRARRSTPTPETRETLDSSAYDTLNTQEISSGTVLRLQRVLAGSSTR